MATLRVAEVVPHLGLPIWGPIRRQALLQAMVSPGPGGPTPALPAKILWVCGPGPGSPSAASYNLTMPVSVAAVSWVAFGAQRLSLREFGRIIPVRRNSQVTRAGPGGRSHESTSLQV